MHLISYYIWQMKTMLISQMQLLNFEDFDRSTLLSSLMEAGLTEPKKEPPGCGKEAPTENSKQTSGSAMSVL